MINLQPGIPPSAALRALRESLRTLDNVQGGFATDFYNKYSEWVGREAGTLSEILDETEVERHVLSKRSITLLALEPSGVPGGTLHSLVQGEIAVRRRVLKKSISRISDDIGLWGQGRVAVVWDTNMWLKHFEELDQFDWIQALGVSATDSLVLTVPMKVVDELDAQKRNQKNPAKGGVSVRKRASRALKTLESLAHEPGSLTSIYEAKISNRDPCPSLELTVLRREIERKELPDGDMEIIESARQIEPYAKAVYLVTTDYGMVYRARQMGLKAVRVPDYEEELDNEVPSQR